MLGRRGAAESRPWTVARSDPRDEARLLDRVAKGELRAFEELYRLYHPRLSRFLVSVIRRPHLVEEALNDTMLAIWAQPDSYSGASKPSTWIFAIAYRKALKTLRGQDEPIEDKHAETRASGEPGAELELGRRQAQTALRAAIDELSADHRAVVDLCYFHDAGYHEIAEIMDCPVDTVKTRMFHARRRLKTKLAGDLADWL